MHDVFWCVLCVWAKLPEIKLDDDDDDDFAPLLNGSPLELSTGAWGQIARMMGLPGRE